jgi:hypothetical protein
VALKMVVSNNKEVWPLVRDFHYSKKMPGVPRFCFGWEQTRGCSPGLKATVIYGHPSGIGWPKDCLELQRLVRVDNFTEPLSKFLSWSVRWLKRETKWGFIVSYADIQHGHYGGIYQATGFIYVAKRKPIHCGYMDTTGRLIHKRTVFARYKTCAKAAIRKINPDWEPYYDQGKYLYVKPLMKRLKPLLKQYNWKPLPFVKPNATCL